MDQTHLFSNKEISGILGITERAVQVRAKNENWKTALGRVRGGRRHLYPLAMLPDEIRSMVIAAKSGISKEAVSWTGFVRGRQAAEEAREAAAIRRKAKADGLAAYNGLPLERQAEADAKFDILKLRDAFILAANLPKKRGTQIFVKEVKEGLIRLPEEIIDAIPSRNGKLPLSFSSINRWEKAYKEQGLVGLAGKYIRTRKTSIPDPMQKFIKAMLVERPHLSLPEIRSGMEARFDGKGIPSTSSLRRFLNQWKKKNAGLLLFMDNPDEWKNRHEFAPGNASEHVERMNQVWEFDSTPADVMLVDGRHAIIGVIDVYSRRVKLLVSPTSKSESIAALTRNAILDWGVPEVAKTDNGADYVSRHMVRVFDGLEIDQVLCQPFTPEAKPHIERFFRTFSHSICELLPGYIGHSVADRKAIEARRSFARRMMNKDSSPIDITMTAEELQSVCDRWIRAIYHQRVHSSLGKTPAQMAREWTVKINRIEDEDVRALDILLSPAPEGKGTRIVKKKGIQVENAFFISPKLAGHEGKTVRVLMDKTDFGVIYVFTEDNDYICTAINRDRAGHDRVALGAKVKAAQKRFYSKKKKEVKALAREVGLDTIHQEIFSYNERKLENIVEMPRASEPYTTPVLNEMARVVEDIDRREMGPVPYEISREEEERCNEVIRMADAKSKMHLPASEMETYQLLMDDQSNGRGLTSNEEQWIAEYDHFLETGKRTGLLAAGFQPFAERNRAAIRSSSGSGVVP